MVLHKVMLLVVIYQIRQITTWDLSEALPVVGSHIVTDLMANQIYELHSSAQLCRMLIFYIINSAFRYH